MFSPPPRRVYNQSPITNYKPSKRKSKSDIPKQSLRNNILIDDQHNKSFLTDGMPTFYEKMNMFQDSRWNSLQKPKNDTSFVGNKARMHFMDSFRTIHLQDNLTTENRNSPINKYLVKINEKHLTPVPMGIVKNHGKINEFEIGMFGMGDDYAEAFSEGISQMRVKKLNLNDNRLTDSGAKRILEKLAPNTLVEFNISNNKLKKANFDQIYGIINARQSVLKILRLEGLQMKDENCGILCKALKKSHCILEVNLAKNSLEGNKSLAKFIQRTKSLEKLDLHWNNIRGDFAIAICKALGKNKSIRVLDLSWNALSSPVEKTCSKQFATSLSMNKTLIHLDISHNSLSCKDIEIIGEGLLENHTLLGLHISGNFGGVDDLGFLSSDPNRRPTSAHRFKRILGISRVTRFLSWRPCSNCWLCEQWNEVEFTWTSEGEDPLYLHLGFEDFEGDLMEKQKDKTYKLVRMCPPGKLYYAYTLDGNLKLNPKEITQKLPEVIEKEFDVYTGKKVSLKINEVNVVESNPKGKDMLALQDDLLALPRMPRKKYLPAEKKKKEWGIPVSIFKDYKFDDDNLIGKCFEYDWARCKVPKLVKDLTELQKIKSYLSSNYRMLKEIYKYYSSISPQGEIWSIGQMAFTDLCNEAKIVDSAFRLSDLDFNMKGALYSETRNSRSPPNALIRFQFMEILVRIGIDKYYRSGIVPCHSEAVIMLIETNIIPNLKHIFSDKWRFERYINEACDIVLKANRHLLKNVYGKYSVKKVKPGQKPFMCLSEFESIVVGADLINDTFTVREICLSFNLGMMTQVQELEFDRQYQMNFVEFLESFSRVADIAKLPDPITKEKPTENTHLSVILSNTIPNLIRLLPLNVQKEYIEKIKKNEG